MSIAYAFGTAIVQPTVFLDLAPVAFTLHLTDTCGLEVMPC